MSGELLLLHSPKCGSCATDAQTLEGGSDMAGRRGPCRRWKNVYSSTTGGTVRRCASFGGGGILGSLGGTPALGSANSLKATFGDVKDVAVTAAIGAGGAILTDIVFDQLVKNIEALDGLEGYTRALAEAGTGIAIGIIVGKFLKRPQLGAKLAMGPVILAALRIAGELLNAGPYAADRGLAGMGMMAIDPYRPELAVGGANDVGAMQVGPGVPGFMLPDGQLNGANIGAFAA